MKPIIFEIIIFGFCSYKIIGSTPGEKESRTVPLFRNFSRRIMCEQSSSAAANALNSNSAACVERNKPLRQIQRRHVQLDFCPSSNNDVMRTWRQDSGYFAYPSNSGFPSLARDATSPLGASPRGARWHLSLAQGTPRLAGRKISLIIRQSPRNVPW